MYQSGDEKQGYKVRPDLEKQVLFLECWGMWEQAVAEDYRKDMLAAYDLIDQKPWFVLADISKFPPQREGVQAVHGELMGIAVERGMLKAASVVDSTLSKMQIRRIAEESRMSELAFHTSEADALAWLLSDQSLA